jgi:asparagine synthase (glutamine-hydrolysing)
MCGIAGIVRGEPTGVAPELLARMASAIQHRGPDGYGFFAGARAGLAHVRLSIVDRAGGAQPMTNEDGRLVVTYHGEVYNPHELRRELEARGHRFHTHCDTEVLVHGYEEWREGMLDRLNGQFAFAIWDRATESLFMARDRFGVRPLFYSVQGGDFHFASEAKALFATGEVPVAPDPVGLDQVFTFWAARPPRTPFAGVSQLEPGSWARWEDGRLTSARWYHLDYPEMGSEPADAVAQLDALMQGSVDFRMRADVPVGGYLSGGLDSSITCALAAKRSPFALRTFSVTFEDPRFDESEFQRTVATQIGSEHAVTGIGMDEIPAVFPEVVRHAETPMLRTAPTPMYQLAKLTREKGIVVVLTGEGSDELFLGYDLFKEVSVRRFCLRNPQSKGRGRLFDRLYPYLMDGGRTGEFWRKFFLEAGRADDPLFSHMPRIALTSRIKDFYSADMRASVAGEDPLERLRSELPAEFARWSPLNQAAYLEMVTLLSPYLLSTQGDRMGMAHGVEGRFPFLDHRLYEFAASLPTGSRLRGLKEKEILKRWARDVVPPEVGARRKQPYRAPDAPPFFSANAPEYVTSLLGADAVRDAGIFEPAAVAGLVRRCNAGLATGFRENQALVAVLSTQLWFQSFMRASQVTAPLPLEGADVFMTEATMASSFPYSVSEATTSHAGY